ncbi:MAG: hypothetical protein RJQ09_08935 [Cyclobacteriaceae bacterium]
MNENLKKRARESRTAIEKIYVNMRHLFNRGSYKPNGISGSSLRSNLIQLNPEIYGSISDPEKVELDGLLYVIDRLPRGIEECRFIKLIAQEGYEKSSFEALIPPKRRRNCYRIDDNSMYIEMTRGRSDVYDILTHLTFIYVEADKIRNHALDSKNQPSQDWQKLSRVVKLEEAGEPFDQNKALTYLSNVLGRTFEETKEAVLKFEAGKNGNSLYHIGYWLGQIAIDELNNSGDREISISTKLRDHIGHHIYGDRWAQAIKQSLEDQGLLNHKVHIISANLHSVLNTLYGKAALPKSKSSSLDDLAQQTSQSNNKALQEKIKKFALKNGLVELTDTAGTNLIVQIIDISKIPGLKTKHKTVVIVMDYAFGEQAFECMDELLKPYEKEDQELKLDVQSISIMGKAGILQGDKGDIMIPTSHVFEGTTDNYPFKNEFTKKDFEGFGLKVFEGSMITVLGTSLQNRDILQYFKNSTWNAIGIEMEGVHYQKAIQAASLIRRSIPENVKVMYAYYASDNPLITGKTLASGSLGPEGVKPTYLITQKILEKIL